MIGETAALTSLDALRCSLVIRVKGNQPTSCREAASFQVCSTKPPVGYLAIITRGAASKAAAVAPDSWRYCNRKLPIIISKPVPNLLQMLLIGFLEKQARKVTWCIVGLVAYYKASSFDCCKLVTRSITGNHYCRFIVSIIWIQKIKYKALYLMRVHRVIQLSLSVSTQT